jgi:hypothetical protein
MNEIVHIISKTWALQVIIERVEEANGMCGLVEEDEEAIGVGDVAVTGEHREVDAERGRSGEVEDVALGLVVGGYGEHHPVAGAEAAVQ